MPAALFKASVMEPLLERQRMQKRLPLSLRSGVCVCTFLQTQGCLCLKITIQLYMEIMSVFKFPQPLDAAEVPFEPTDVRCARFLRSKIAVFCSSVVGINFSSSSLYSFGLGLAGAFDLAARALLASLRPRPGRAERKRTDPDKPSLPGVASQSGP